MPGKLVLANTLERVELPILPGKISLAARVEGRSSFARCGCSYTSQRRRSMQASRADYSRVDQSGIDSHPPVPTLIRLPAHC
jgi:hypothetical protein